MIVVLSNDQITQYSKKDHTRDRIAAIGAGELLLHQHHGGGLGISRGALSWFGGQIGGEARLIAQFEREPVPLLVVEIELGAIVGLGGARRRAGGGGAGANARLALPRMRRQGAERRGDAVQMGAPLTYAAAYHGVRHDGHVAKGAALAAIHIAAQPLAHQRTLRLGQPQAQEYERRSKKKDKRTSPKGPGVSFVENATPIREAEVTRIRNISLEVEEQPSPKNEVKEESDEVMVDRENSAEDRTKAEIRALDNEITPKDPQRGGDGPRVKAVSEQGLLGADAACAAIAHLSSSMFLIRDGGRIRRSRREQSEIDAR